MLWGCSVVVPTMERRNTDGNKSFPASREKIEVRRQKPHPKHGVLVTIPSSATSVEVRLSFSDIRSLLGFTFFFLCNMHNVSNSTSHCFYIKSYNTKIIHLSLLS